MLKDFFLLKKHIWSVVKKNDLTKEEVCGYPNLAEFVCILSVFN